MTLGAGLCHAQNAITNALKGQVDGLRDNVLAAAEKMKEADYSFRPSPEVMSFHEMLGHIADANYSLCSGLKGEANPHQGAAAKRAAGKAVVSLVKESFEYCDAALAGLNDARLGETVMRGARERPRAYFGLHLLDHIALHYGNLVTYMRLRGVVPPESERPQTAAPAKK